MKGSCSTLVAIIEDMIIDELRRFVRLRIKRESLTPADRDAVHVEMQAVRRTMEGLCHFRARVLERHYKGIGLPGVVRSRQSSVARDVLRLTETAPQGL